MQKHRFNYEWNLKDTEFTKDKGKVFSCFACGGGSTMGYKLAGFDVVGCNEIDPKMMAAYIKNHNPKHSYLEPIQDFKNRDDLPEELFNLDILDGSPPCSSFSMAGNREKDWGKEKRFGEGKADQVLDTLFFDFIDLAKKLQPKVVVAENVKGLILGDAKEYVMKIYDAFIDAGYQAKVDPYLLDASKMGVPQKRERVIFVALRNDISSQFMEDIDMFQRAPKLDLQFNEPPIRFGDIREDIGSLRKTDRQELIKKHFMHGDKDISDINLRVNNKNSGFNASIIYDEDIVNTIDSKGEKYRACDQLHFTDKEFQLSGSYPLDYDFNNARPSYLIGMSVPPLMIAHIATQINEQWFEKL